MVLFLGVVAIRVARERVSGFCENGAVTVSTPLCHVNHTGPGELPWV